MTAVRWRSPGRFAGWFNSTQSGPAILAKKKAGFERIAPSVHPGARVSVKGQLLEDGTVLAQEIEVQKSDDQDDELQGQLTDDIVGDFDLTVRAADAAQQVSEHVFELRVENVPCGFIGALSVPFFIATRGWDRDYEGVGHGFANRVYADAQVIQWLLNQKKAEGKAEQSGGE